MRSLSLAYGNSHQAKTWVNKTILFDELKERLKVTIRTLESAEEYANMNKAQRDLAKDHGGFVGRVLKEGIKTIRGNTRWNVNSIRTILINEKYIGDAMAQKTFTIDYLTKTRKENQGELQKYYVENAHEEIIPREIFYKVREELHQRANIYKKSSKQETESKGKHSGKYALSKITL